MTYRRNKLAYAVHAVLAGTGLVAVLPGVAWRRTPRPRKSKKSS